MQSYDSYAEDVYRTEDSKKKGAKIKIGIVEGKIAFEVIDPISRGYRPSQIPQRYVDVLNACLQLTLMISSSYDRGDIKIIKSGLTKVSQYHLDKLSKMLKEVSRLKVTYLEKDMSRNPGQDAGGLLRDYLSSLFGGLIHDPELEFAQSPLTGLWEPLALSDDENALRVYQRWGRVLMLCYLSSSPKLTTGAYLQNSPIEAALSLSSGDITHFGHKTRLKLLGLLFEKNKETFTFEDGETVSGKEMIDLICDETRDWSEEEMARGRKFRNALQSLIDRELPPPSTSGDSRRCSVLQSDIVSYLTHKDYEYNKRAVAVHALAKGMKSYLTEQGRDWDVFLQVGLDAQTRRDGWIGLDREEFCLKAQGTLDRQAIAEAFTTESTNEHILRKLSWLKEWLANPATPANEIRQVLLYLSGSAGVQGPNTIKIMEMNAHIPPTPFVQVHTCFLTIDMYPGQSEVLDQNDRAKEAFIECLKCQAKEEGFSMA